MKYTDTELLSFLKEDRELGMKYLFDNYYNYMCHAVYKIIPDSVTVEDIVQDVFLEIWKKRQQLNVTISFKAYLRRAAVNKSLNFIRSRRLVFEEEDTIKETFIDEADSQRDLEVDELKLVITEAVDSLPEKCRLVFSLSRFEELSYKEIAAQLSISVKTVENQISKALKILRIAVKEHQTLIL